MLNIARRLLLLSVSLVAHTAATADVSYLDRCLSGKVNRPACTTMIENFWRHNDHLERAARAKGLDPSLIKAMAAVESRFKANAVSPKGATGLLQIMPATGTELGIHPSRLTVPEANAMAGAQYVRDMYFRFRDWPLAIAAYNAGPGAVSKYGNRIPPYRETQAYVTQVLALYRRFKHSEQLHSKAPTPMAMPPAPSNLGGSQISKAAHATPPTPVSTPTSLRSTNTAAVSASQKRPAQVALSHQTKVNRFQQSVTRVGRFQYLE